MSEGAAGRGTDGRGEGRTEEKGREGRESVQVDRTGRDGRQDGTGNDGADNRDPNKGEPSRGRLDKEGPYKDEKMMMREMMNVKNEYNQEE